MAGAPEWGFSNAPGKRRCPVCKRRGLRFRYGKLQFHFAVGACPSAEICAGGHIPTEEISEHAKVHPTTCGCQERRALNVPEKRKGRVEIVSVRRKKGERYRKEYIIRVLAGNGRQVASSGESYVRRQHAVKMAYRNAAGRPVYLDGELVESPGIPIAAG